MDLVFILALVFFCGDLVLIKWVWRERARRSKRSKVTELKRPA